MDCGRNGTRRERGAGRLRLLQLRRAALCLRALQVEEVVEIVHVGQRIPRAAGTATQPQVHDPHLGTIAQQTGRRLRTDPRTGRILGDADAMKRWTRPYAPGWAPSA